MVHKLCFALIPPAPPSPPPPPPPAPCRVRQTRTTTLCPSARAHGPAAPPPHAPHTSIHSIRSSSSSSDITSLRRTATRSAAVSPDADSPVIRLRASSRSAQTRGAGGPVGAHAAPSPTGIGPNEHAPVTGSAVPHDNPGGLRLPGKSTANGREQTDSCRLSTAGHCRPSPHHPGGGGVQGCSRREGTPEAAPEAVR